MKLLNIINKKEIELKNKNINMYVCGPTVYNHIHIGNARPLIIYDLLNRVLLHEGKKVNFVHNLTDIDDKIIEQAKKEGQTEEELSQRFINEYLRNMKLLNVLTPTHLPRVTDNIDAIISFIKQLLQKKYAYVKNGNVFFDVKKCKFYGEISHQNIKNLKDFEISLDKKNSIDFALWKKTNEGINFDSPWGKGRPGWHTECVAIIKKYFNKTLDIHAGGIDLKFPHHENENAQWKILTKTNLAKIWNYVGHINVNDIKMSKSLNNVLLVKDFLKKYSPNHLRYLMYITNYRQPLNISDEVLVFVNSEITKIKAFLFKALINGKKINENALVDSDIIKHVNDDLNTPLVLTRLLELQKDLNFFSIFFNSLKFLGFAFWYNPFDPMVLEYKKEKASKNYEKSDKLRKKIYLKLNWINDETKLK